MSVSSMDELRLAFDESDPGRILGTAEGSWVDFKSQPYLLNTDKGSWELCKDVAAFANAGGGYIVIGIATTKNQTDTTERASDLRAVPLAMANRDQHRDKIVAGVFPSIDGLTISTHAHDEHGCYLTIHVPAQSADGKPFLVRYLVDSDGKRVNGFGWPVRVDDAITWQSCEHFQTRLSLGGLLQAAAAQRAPQRIEPSAEMLRRHRRVLEAMEHREPVLLYQFTPLARTDLTAEMYGADGLASVVQTRKPLRARGFNVAARGGADVRGDRGVEWGSRWRTAIDSDGVVVAAAPVTDTALAWADQSGSRGPIISPTFLLEWTNDVFRMFYEAVQPRAGLAIGQWSVAVVALGMSTGLVRLPRLDPRYTDDEDLHRATSDEFSRNFEMTGAADRDTYRALTLFYALFGLGSDAIPFSRSNAFAAEAFLEDVRR